MFKEVSVVQVREVLRRWLGGNERAPASGCAPVSTARQCAVMSRRLSLSVSPGTAGKPS